MRQHIGARIGAAAATSVAALLLLGACERQEAPEVTFPEPSADARSDSSRGLDPTSEARLPAERTDPSASRLPESDPGAEAGAQDQGIEPQGGAGVDPAEQQ